MTIFSQRQRRTIAHPPWCDVPRCLTGLNQLGEHRSAPMKLGPAVITLSQRHGEREPRLEMNTRTRLRNGTDAGQRHAAELVISVLTAIKATRRDHTRHNSEDHDYVTTKEV